MSAVALLPAGEVHRVDADGIVMRLRIEPWEPVFTGHYPSFALVPGVYLVDAVHRAVLEHAARRGEPRPRLTRIRSARFSSTVLPGDDLEVACTITVADGVREVRAQCTTGRGKAATCRLSYLDGDREVAGRG